MKRSRSELLAELYCFGAVLLIVFHPSYLGNECVYLLGSRRIADPLFLSGDWSMSGSPFATTNAIFNLLVAPFWWMVGNGLLIAMAGRVAVSALVLTGLFGVTRQLKMAPWLVCLGFSLWLFGDHQTFAASEWIFGGFEQKSLAYACLLFALSFVIRGRLSAAGALCGLACAFHILVGGYGTLALGAAVVLDFRRHGRKKIIRFALSALPLSIAALALGIRYLQSGGPASAPGQIDWVMVHLRNPHHLDPSYFLKRTDYYRGVSMIAVVAYGLWRYAPREAVRVVLPFLMVLCGIFVGGVIASAIGWDEFLVFYPFRTADTLLPLFFWLTVALWLGQTVTDLRVPEKRRKPGYWIALAALGLLPLLQIPDASRVLGRDIHRTGSSWKEMLRGERTPKQEALDWIRRNTPRNANFLVPVCLGEFWLEAERPVLVLYRLAPSNDRAIEWLDRMKAANGGHEIQAVGWKICSEIDSNYRMLSEDELSELVRRYGLTHYLVDRKRPDLSQRMVFSNEAWWVYEIGSIPEEVRPGS